MIILTVLSCPPIEAKKTVKKTEQEIDRTCALCGSDSTGNECHYIFYCPFLIQNAKCTNFLVEK